jgi:hypothetical protein
MGAATPNISSESAKYQKLKYTSIIFLFLHGVATCISILDGLLYTFMGTILLNFSIAGYQLFILKTLGIPALIGISFYVSKYFYTHKQYLKSILLSAIISLIIGIVGWPGLRFWWA